MDISNNKQLGFIQGRLSPIVNGMIQAFPWQQWEAEFIIGAKHGWSVIEWTLDAKRLYENPLMTKVGRERILRLCAETNFTIPNLTGDFFMQKPFFKEKEVVFYEKLLSDLIDVIQSCAAVGIKIIVLPLVDNGSIENAGQEEALFRGLTQLEQYLCKYGVKVAFESNFAPKELNDFINKLNPNYFGINYDIGNSASLGFDYNDEINSYFERILNVHIKDRVLGGITVPLGLGVADIPGVLALLRKKGYDGNYILQTARAQNDDHVGALNQYRDYVLNECFPKEVEVN